MNTHVAVIRRSSSRICASSADRASSSNSGPSRRSIRRSCSSTGSSRRRSSPMHRHRHRLVHVATRHGGVPGVPQWSEHHRQRDGTAVRVGEIPSFSEGALAVHLGLLTRGRLARAGRRRTCRRRLLLRRRRPGRAVAHGAPTEKRQRSRSPAPGYTGVGFLTLKPPSVDPASATDANARTCRSLARAGAQRHRPTAPVAPTTATSRGWYTVLPQIGEPHRTSPRSVRSSYGRPDPPKILNPADPKALRFSAENL